MEADLKHENCISLIVIISNVMQLVSQKFVVIFARFDWLIIKFYSIC